MRLKNLVIGLMVVFGCMGPVMAETAVAAPAPEVAADIMTMARDARCGQVLVTALVNGVPLRMMLDTGATHTVLHEESVSKLGEVQWVDTSRFAFKGNSTQMPRLLLAPLQTGPGVSPSHPMMVMNLGAVRSMMEEKIDGILGMDFLGSLPFTFDFRKNAFYWGTPEAGDFVPVMGEVERSGRVRWLTRCQGKEIKLLLDTGSSVTRICADDWLPGAAGEIKAHIGDIDTTSAQQFVEGKPGDLEVAPGVVLKGVTPILCGSGEFTILGVDALRDSVLVHVPAVEVPGGVFLMSPTTGASPEN